MVVSGDDAVVIECRGERKEADPGGESDVGLFLGPLYAVDKDRSAVVTAARRCVNVPKAIVLCTRDGGKVKGLVHINTRLTVATCVDLGDVYARAKENEVSKPSE